MTFKETIITCIQFKYVDFKSRANCSEYWYFCLFCYLMGFGASVLDDLVFGTHSVLLKGIVQLGLLLPGLAVVCRRLHDANYSIWWICAYYAFVVAIATLIIAIAPEIIVLNSDIPSENLPAIGVISAATYLPFLIIGLLKSYDGTNKYGAKAS